MYKITNDKNPAVVEYFLQHDKALQSVRELMEWFTGVFHIETQIVEATV
jgi:hypothetical protein